MRLDAAFLASCPGVSHEEACFALVSRFVGETLILLGSLFLHAAMTFGCFTMKVGCAFSLLLTLVNYFSRVRQVVEHTDACCSCHHDLLRSQKPPPSATPPPCRLA